MTNALKTADILLPAEGIDPEKWAVVACDQFTAQPEYWQAVAERVGDCPSALRVTLPEVWLDQAETRISAIHAAMGRYLESGVWQTAVKDGFVLVARQTSNGLRPGLLVCLDLDQYDFDPGAHSLIRPTEGTVISRVPPRARIRAGAPVELPHVMMLIDDPGETVIEPLLRRSEALRPLYDFELMQGGGHVQGWAVEGEDVKRVFAAIDALNERAGGLLYAVGDGNHSLAAAKKCWMDIRERLSDGERAAHPARWAMVELVNLACPALRFEPIHRALFNVQPGDVLREYREYLASESADAGEGEDLVALYKGHRIGFRSDEHPLRRLQPFLDDYIARHPGAEIDYIHGSAALMGLLDREDTLGFMPRPFDKAELFGYIRRFGVLPRKTFSMGEAQDKRYYLEARRILP